MGLVRFGKSALNVDDIKRLQHFPADHAAGRARPGEYIKVCFDDGSEEMYFDEDCDALAKLIAALPDLDQAVDDVET